MTSFRFFQRQNDVVSFFIFIFFLNKSQNDIVLDKTATKRRHLKQLSLTQNDAVLGI